MEPESALLESARQGSEAAFTKLVRLHQAHVRAYLGGFVRNREAVDDLAQEVFLAAFRSLPEFRGESSLRLWLLGIARHRALSFLRDEASRRTHEGAPLRAALEQWLSRAPEPAAPGRALSALEACVKNLPPTSTQLVVDHYRNGRSTGDIARRSGRNESAVRKALFRIRMALRECVHLRLSTSEVDS